MWSGRNDPRVEKFSLAGCEQMKPSKLVLGGEPLQKFLKLVLCKDICEKCCVRSDVLSLRSAMLGRERVVGSGCDLGSGL